MQRLLLLGLNHATAPLAVRERVAFSSAQRAEAIARFQQRFPEAEIVLLSTCNRVELYCARAAHGHPTVDEMASFVAGFHGVPIDDVRGHFYQKLDKDVAHHLFTVAASLDSMVLGETQILGQVREAYEAAREAGSAGKLLHPMFQRAVAVGKEVQNRTAIGEGRLSVASVAVDYARTIFDKFADKTVLAVGAGKMTRLVLRHFADLKPRQLVVCNRDVEKAHQLASEFAGVPAALERLNEELIRADVVVTSTGAPHAIITRKTFETVMRARRYRPIFLIDIALPRDIEASVGDMEHVYLYNIDDLQQVVSATQTHRTSALDDARMLIASALEDFAAWHRTRQAAPLIERLFARSHAIAGEEVARTLNKLQGLDEQERAALEEMARRIVNKILHDPVHTLRNAEGLHSPAGQYLHAMQKLFRLEEGEPGEKTDEPG